MKQNHHTHTSRYYPAILVVCCWGMFAIGQNRLNQFWDIITTLCFAALMAGLFFIPIMVFSSKLTVPDTETTWNRKIGLVLAWCLILIGLFVVPLDNFLGG